MRWTDWLAAILVVLLFAALHEASYEEPPSIPTFEQEWDNERFPVPLNDYTG